jgi:hypothetical protein
VWRHASRCGGWLDEPQGGLIAAEEFLRLFRSWTGPGRHHEFHCAARKRRRSTGTKVPSCSVESEGPARSFCSCRLRAAGGSSPLRKEGTGALTGTPVRCGNAIGRPLTCWGGCSGCRWVGHTKDLDRRSRHSDVGAEDYHRRRHQWAPTPLLLAPSSACQLTGHRA